MSTTIVGNAVIIVGADATEFQKQLPKQTEPAAKAAGVNMAGALGKALGAGAAIVGGSVAAVIGEGLAKGFSRLTAIDDAKAKLTGLGHSATEVTAIMASALASVKGTAFRLGEAAGQAAVLVAAGVKPGQDLTRTLKLLADTSTIAGTSLSDIGSIFGKVAANGKVTGEVIGQLQDRGVPALQFLSKQTGLSMSEVIKAVSAGKINFETFQKAMEGGLGGAALSSGKTFSGAMANVGAALGRLGAQVLGGVFSKLPGLLNESIGSLDTLAPVAKQVGEVLGTGFGKAVGLVQTFVGQLQTGTGPGGVFRQVVADIGKALLIMFDSGMKVISFMKEHQALSESLAISMGALLLVTQAHATVLAVQAAGGLVAYISQINIVQTATSVWAAVQWVLNSALLANPIGIVVVAVAALVAGIIIAYKNSETFRDIVGAAWAGVQVAIGAVAGWITGTVVPWIVGAWNSISSGAQTLLGYIQTAWSGIMAAIQPVGAWITGTLVPWLAGAWNNITTGAKILWDDTVTIWNGIKATLDVVGSWINNTFGPSFRTFQALVEFVFKAIEILILAFWELVVLPAFQGVQVAISDLGAVFNGLWNNVISPVFNFIANAARVVFQTELQIAFLAVQVALQALGAVFNWLYANVKAVWDGAVVVVKAAWTAIQAIWSALTAGLQVLGGWFSDLYAKYIKPAWDSIGAAIKTVWNSVISPVFDALNKAVGAIGGAFDKAVQGVKVAWDKLQDIAKAPIKFVIETVLNNGLIKAFNTLGSAVGGPHIDNIPLPFAGGGVLPGYTPGRDVHQFYSPTAGRLALSGGEAIMRPEFTKAVGGAGGVARLNKMAVRGFAGGGVLDFIKNAGASAFSWVGNAASSIWQGFQDPAAFLKKLMPSVPGSGAVVQYAEGAAGKLLTAAVDKIKSLFSAFNDAFAQPAAGIGGGVQQWTGTVLQALGMLGLPANLLNTVLAQITTESGGNPNAVQGNIGDINNITGNLARGLMQVIPPTFAAYHVGGTSSNIFDPLANIAAGLNYASHRYGGAAGISATLGHGHGYAAGGVYRPLLFDRGGVLPPGDSMVRNATGSPEALYPGGGDLNVSIQLSIDDLAKLKTLDDFLKMLDNARVNGRKTARSGRTAS